MTLLVSTIINTARDAHPALSRANAPEPIALRVLSMFQRAVIRDAAYQVPGWKAAELSVSFPLATFADGIDLDAEIPDGWQDLTDGYVRYTNAPAERRVLATFSPWEQRDMNRCAPAYTLRDNTLFFLGGERAYSQIAEFILTYTPLAPAITLVTDAVVLPDDFLECAAAHLAAQWLKRLVGVPSFNVDGGTARVFLDDATSLRADFISRIRRTAQRQTYRVRDVGYVGGGQ